MAFSFRFVSFRFVSFRFVSFRFVSFRFVLFCFVLFRRKFEVFMPVSLKNTQLISFVLEQVGRKLCLYSKGITNSCIEPNNCTVNSIFQSITPLSELLITIEKHNYINT